MTTPEQGIIGVITRENNNFTIINETRLRELEGGLEALGYGVLRVSKKLLDQEINALFEQTAGVIIANHAPLRDPGEHTVGEDEAYRAGLAHELGRTIMIHTKMTGRPQVVKTLRDMGAVELGGAVELVPKVLRGEAIK